MREYSKVGPKFWIGATGKRLRTAGMEAQVVAMYLLTSPHANMLGLYYLPTMFIAHETGLGFEGALRGLGSCIEAGFCHYDEISEVVWVVEMARYQVADALKPNDLRVKGVQNEYDKLPANPYLARFYEYYEGAFHMSRRRDASGEETPPSSALMQAPSKPLASQKQEQEQEQAQKETHAPLPAPPTKASRSAPALGVKELMAEGVEKQHAEDWLKARKAKRLPLTATALDGVKREAEKAGMTLAQAIERAATENWAGFKASWLDKTTGGAPQLPESFYGRDYGEAGAI